MHLVPSRVAGMSSTMSPQRSHWKSCRTAISASLPSSHPRVTFQLMHDGLLQELLPFQPVTPTLKSRQQSRLENDPEILNPYSDGIADEHNGVSGVEEILPQQVFQLAAFVIIEVERLLRAMFHAGNEALAE